MGSSAAMLRVAASTVGYREGPRNNETKFGKWYGMDRVPWCDEWVSWCGQASGNRTAVGKFAYTPFHAQWFKNQGRWGTTPRVGAIVFFRFFGSTIHHVGIVERVLPGGGIQTIEGNTNGFGSREGNGVYRKIRRFGVVGYGYPNYTTGTSPSSAASGVPGGLVRFTGTLVQGARGPMVKAMQRKVGATPDGIWGARTTAALKRWQRAHRLVGDGVFGPRTFGVMF